MNRDLPYPCLLDRLLDERPERREETRRQRGLSLAEFRAAVLRDLQWLLNASRQPPDHDLYLYPEVASSVLNFGVRDHGGQTSGGIDSEAMAREIRGSILQFEPRILPAGLRVTPIPDKGQIGELAFEIRAQLWSLPYPEPMVVHTRLDLETGAHEVTSR